MANTRQGSAKTLSIVLSDTLYTAPGFLNRALTGTFTGAAVGNNYLITGVGSLLLAELNFLEGVVATSYTKYPTDPIYNYLYDPDSGLITKILQVIDNTHVLVESDIGVSSDNILATSSIIGNPTRVEIESSGNANTGITVGDPEQPSPVVTATGSSLRRLGGDGNLIPFTVVWADPGASATVAY